MSLIASYSKIYNLGHKAIAQLTHEHVIVEEKIDGSQFSFMKDATGKLHFRSKGAAIDPDTPQALFAPAVAGVQEVAERLPERYVFRAEALHRPKHNTLTYSRVPKHNFIVFDIENATHGVDKDFLRLKEKQELCDNIGIECVPLLSSGYPPAEHLKELLETESCLGGCKIEGVVVKPAWYDLFGLDGKVLMGKYVSERFKEVHASDWKQRNPNRGDVVATLIERLTTEARWRKAVQHLQEQGQFSGDVKDIGQLIRLVQQNVLDEESDRIKDALYDWAKPQIVRGVTRGFAEWYKEQLAVGEFK